MEETTVSILQNASMKTGNSNYVSYKKPTLNKATKRSSAFGSRVSFDEQDL